MDDLNNTNNEPATPEAEGTEADAAEALFARWTKKDAEKPSNEPDEGEQPDDDNETVDDDAEDEVSEEEADEAAEESDEDPQEEAGDEDEETVTFADDTAKVKITVDGADHEVSVKDLKRLWGQEASLTRKSQEVATARKAVDEHQKRYELGLSAMYDKAVARAKPYAQIDFALAAKNLNDADYAQLKRDAQAAFDEVRYFEQEIGQHMETQTKTQKEAHTKAADECLKALQDKENPNYIPDWSDALYDDLRAYGVKHGITATQMDNLVDPVSFKLLWKAQQFDKAKTVAATKKTKVVGKKPISTRKSANTSTKSPVEKLNRLRRSGSVEDAAAALLEGWGI